MHRPILGLLLSLIAAACTRGSPAPVQYATPPITMPSGIPGHSMRVEAGDTVFALARRHEVPVRDLIEANGLVPPYQLQPGQAILIPAMQTHLVQPGETLYGLSRRYGLDMHEVARANGLSAPYAVRTGDRLRVPRRGIAEPAPVAVAAAPPVAKPLPPRPVAPVTATPLPTEATPATAPPPQPTLPPAVPAAPPAATETVAPAPAPTPIAEPPPRSGRDFLWPVNGKLVSRYGPKPGGLQNDGINIAAPLGAAVRAADSGVVVYAGNELRGFGNLLLVRHAEGWVSAYAHNDQLLVNRGDQVKRGQVIAKVGSTGSVTEPQLHFELRQGVNAVDPLRYLGKPTGPAISSMDDRAGQPNPG